VFLVFSESPLSEKGVDGGEKGWTAQCSTPKKLVEYTPNTSSVPTLKNRPTRPSSSSRVTRQRRVEEEEEAEEAEEAEEEQDVR
jgi:hypothetical protein